MFLYNVFDSKFELNTSNFLNLFLLIKKDGW